MHHNMHRHIPPHHMTHAPLHAPSQYLGIYIDENMKFISHINKITNTASRNVGMMSRIRHFVETRQLIQLYNAIILPYLNYCCLIWGTGYAHHTKKMLILQKRAVRIIEGIYPPQSASPVFKKYYFLKVQDIAKIQMMLVMHRYICNILPEPMRLLFNLCINSNYSTRQSKHFQCIFSNKNYRLFTIACLGPKLWNNIIPRNMSLSEVPRSKDAMKKILKDHFVSTY